MANAALFIAWNEPKIGMEMRAAELFQMTLGYFANQQKQGYIESFEPVLLHRHGGDMNGFMLIRGEGDKLDAMIRTDEFLDITVKASAWLDGFGYVHGYIGNELMKVMKRYTAVVSQG